MTMSFICSCENQNSVACFLQYIRIAKDVFRA